MLGGRRVSAFWLEFALSLVVALPAFSLVGCTGDPNDPKTWAKKLDNPRERDEALNRIANMDTERAKAVLPELMALYEQTRSPEHLQALVRYKDERTIPIFIDALDYTDESFDKAIVASSVLGEMKAESAVEKLIAAAEQPLPIKSRANSAKMEAMRALVKIGDRRAVPTLIKILSTSADEQDFLLNQRAALGLAEFADPSSIPALVGGLFMTGRGTNIFQECRLALVRMGQASVDPIIELFRGDNADVEEMGEKYDFDGVTPGVVQEKAAYLLGDLRAAKAVPILVSHLNGPAKGHEHSAIAIALGQIGTPQAVNALIAVASDGKREPIVRASASDALYISGDRRAIPTLMGLAKSGYITTPGGEKASDLRANAAIDLARLAGAEHYDAFKAMADAETEVQGVFGEALDRFQVAKECGQDLACYGKALGDPSWTRAEKAAFAIGFSDDPKGIPYLLENLKPLAALPQQRYPVHQAILFGLVRLGDKSCEPCIAKLTEQIERDEKSVRIPGARGLLAETRVALATIQGTEPGARKAAMAAAPAAQAVGEAKAKGRGKANAKGKRARGKRRR